MTNYEISDYKELLRGCEAYVKNEPRDAMYKVVNFLVSHFWDNVNEITDGLGYIALRG